VREAGVIASQAVLIAIGIDWDEPIKINGDVLQPTIGQEPIEQWCFPVEMPFDQPGRGDPFASILRALIGGGKQNPPVKPFRSWPRLIAYA
jgi:hypothetical protein